MPTPTDALHEALVDILATLGGLRDDAQQGADPPKIEQEWRVLNGRRETLVGLERRQSSLGNAVQRSRCRSSHEAGDWTQLDDATTLLARREQKPYSNRMEVHVTPETAKKLKNLAETSGRAPADIVEDALAGYLEEVASVRKTLDSRYDDLKSGRVKPIDGEEAFRKLREKSERRRSGG